MQLYYLSPNKMEKCNACIKVMSLWLGFCCGHLVRMQEASTALMRRLRKPPLSRKCSAWMVAPPGEQTLSFSCPGCSSESRSILAAPYDRIKTRVHHHKHAQCTERPYTSGIQRDVTISRYHNVSI